ncbi:MAG: CAP domain-containing protein [Alphaproteobacteria bacterium]|nr:CAP domain-containing protein [Alphaproteobacteria bacterium]
MFARLSYLLIASLAWVGIAQACDMSLDRRSTAVDDYVRNGKDCLRRPVGGFVYSPSMEAEFVALINQARATHGLESLKLRQETQGAARFHSLDMAVNGFFDHASPDGRKHGARIAAFDRRLFTRMSAENVAMSELICEDWRGERIDCAKLPDRRKAYTADVIEGLHQQLMDSPGHRKNILSHDATHISLGVAVKGDAVYVTQLFTQPVGVLDEPLPTRLAPGQALDLNITMANWRFKRFALFKRFARQDLFAPELPEDMDGDYKLGFRGERTVEADTSEGAGSYEFIYLPGPAFTSISTKESS